MLKEKVIILCKWIQKALLGSVVLLISINICILIMGYRGYWINITNSMPIGIYKEIESMKIPKYSYVLICKEDESIKRTRNAIYYCDDGHQPLLKIVVATEGDLVTINDEGIFVNRKKIRHTERLQKFRNVSFNIHDYKLRNNEYLVTGNSPYSWDSRYFGIVSGNDFLSPVVPVYLF